MEKGNLLNKLFENSFKDQEALSIIADPTFDRLRDSDDNWLYRGQQLEEQAEGKLEDEDKHSYDE